MICTIVFNFKLENVAINDVLPLKAARRDPIASYNINVKKTAVYTNVNGDM